MNSASNDGASNQIPQRPESFKSKLFRLSKLSFTGMRTIVAESYRSVLSKRRPNSGPENSSGDLKPHKPDSSSLSEAIRLAQQGDAAAFEIIYQQHSRRVYALCLRM